MRWSITANYVSAAGALGVVVGRIFKAQVAPEGRPWMWASGHSGHAAHGYEATREAPMAAFAKSWRCPKVGQTTQVDKNRLGPGTDFTDTGWTERAGYHLSHCMTTLRVWPRLAFSAGPFLGRDLR